MKYLKSRAIGLIGGMGPFASSYFYNLLLKKSGMLFGAKNNEDFPEILIDSVPVPDFISNRKHLRLAKNILKDRVKRINKFGCGALAMICNTSHLIYDELSTASDCEFISLIKLVSDKVKERQLSKVGLLSTPITIKSGLYRKEFLHSGASLIVPDRETVNSLEKIIRKAISGSSMEALKNSLRNITESFIKKKKLDGIILGCTELPLIFPKKSFKNVFDCLDILADELLIRYYKRGEK